MKLVDRALSRSKAVVAVRGYIRSTVRILLWSLLTVIVLSSINVPVTSIIAVFSVAGLAVSLALQNTLSNLASGIVTMVSKPFVVGDYVEIDNVGGTVSTVGLVYSMLVTPENKEIYIPNSQVSAAKVINYTHLGRRRMELFFSASYDAPTDDGEDRPAGGSGAIPPDSLRSRPRHLAQRLQRQLHRVCGPGLDHYG